MSNLEHGSLFSGKTFRQEQYSPKQTRKLQDELDIRQQEEREIESVESPFLRGLAKAISRLDFALKPLSMDLLHPEKLLEKKQLQESIERQSGYAQKEALELNKRYEKLLVCAKEGIAKIKALDEDQDASALCGEAMAGVQAILELRMFEEKFLGMRTDSPEG